jgi:hypothetical protein
MNQKLMIARFFLIVLAALLLLGYARNASASPGVTFTVNTRLDGVNISIGEGLCDIDATAPGQQCSLRAAIQEANATVAADTIILPAGLYPLDVLGAGEDAAATGDLDITEPLTLQGAGAGSTFINGNRALASGYDRVFDIYADATISGVTIQDGRAIYAGAIRSSATVALVDTIVSGNDSDSDSGGIFNGGAMTLTNSQVISNTAATRAGGISNVHHLTLVDSVVSGNSTAIGEAGGLHNFTFTSVMTLTNSTISGNIAARGGGLFNSGGWVTVMGSTFSGNRAVDLHGGAVYNSGHLNMLNSTLSGNRAANFGGGLFNEPNGAVSIKNSTIPFNFADNNDNNIGSGGGLYNNGGFIQMGTTLLWGNLRRGPIVHAPDECGGTITSMSHNWLKTAEGCTLAGGVNVSGVDPLLGPLQSNGGPTATHALLEGSPAIDSGPPTYCRDHDGAVLTTDQRGLSRHVDGNGNGTAFCDPGAFEFQVTYFTYLPLATREGVAAR